MFVLVVYFLIVLDCLVVCTILCQVLLGIHTTLCRNRNVDVYSVDVFRSETDYILPAILPYSLDAPLSNFGMNQSCPIALVVMIRSIDRFRQHRERVADEFAEFLARFVETDDWSNWIVRFLLD